MQTSPGRTRRGGGHGRSGPLLRSRDGDAAPPQHRAPVAASRAGTRGRPAPARLRPVLAGGAAAAVLLAGAGFFLLNGDDAPPGASSTGPRASTSPAAVPSAAAAVELPASVVAATGADRTAAAAQTALEEQLSARANGMTALLRATWDRDITAAARAADAVATAGTGVRSVVTTWWDVDLGERITAGLAAQTAASRDYAAAVAADDGTRADEARARMAEVSRDLGGVLAEVTDDRIAAYVPPQDAAQYRAFVDALEADDAAAADAAEAWLQGRLRREGTALAAALPGGGPS